MKSEHGLEEHKKRSEGRGKDSNLLPLTKIQGLTSLQCLAPRGCYMSWQKWLVMRKIAVLQVCNKS